MKQKLYLIFVFLLSISINAQTETLPYSTSASMTAGSGLSATLTNFSTCQSSVSATFTAAGFSGTWSNGNFDYYVNNVLIGSGVGSQTYDISAYMPVTSVRIVKTNYNNWNQVWITVNVTSLASGMPSAPAVSNVTYCQNAIASPLTATLSGTGTTLKWYTTALGDNYSATAPTPSTTTVGTTSYWVAQANASGCESLRSQIDVTVLGTPATPTVSTPVIYAQGGYATPLTATSGGTGLLWYTASTGGTGYTTAPTPSTTTLGSTSYWVSSTNACGLESARVQIVVTVEAAQTLPYSTDAAMTAGSGLSATLTNFSTCQSSVSATFTAAGFSGTWSNGNFDYYVNNVLIGSGVGSQTYDISAYMPVTSVRIVKTNYNNWNQVWITVNVTSLASGMPSAPAVTNVTYCQNATASPLTATLSGSGTTLKWYTTALGNNYSATAPTPSTTTAGTTSYWVAQANASGCESLRSQIDVIVNATPSAPTASAQTFCNTATVADLVATGSGLQWYAVSTGGTALVSTASLSTGTYYVSQTITGCESTRTAVSVTVNIPAAPTASAQTFCNTATVANLVATGSGLQWYAASTGGSALISTTSLATGTYYVSQTISGCESATRTAVSVTVNVTPTPTASAQTFCNTATVANLVATGTGLQWYAASTGGSALISTTSLATGTYYVSQTISGCESATRTAVSVTVNVTPTPTASAQTFCNTATVANLVATGTGLQWYAASTGGSALISTTSLSTATYYVSQTISGCESATRIAVSVTVNVTPTPTASAQTFCNTATVADLVATGSGLQWYAASTGGSALISTTSLATGTYYVSQTVSGCESATRTAVGVTVNVTPAPTASAQTFCNTATVADLVATGSDLQWYAASTGGMALASTTSLSTGTYYVSQTVSGCESDTRTAVSVTMATIGLIRQHWSDVIFFDNSSNEYVTFKWYKDGQLISGESKQFLKENGGLDGAYFAKAMTTSGNEVTSCTLVIVPNNEIRSIKVIPNPNESGQMTTIKMSLSETELLGAKLYLFSITGELLNVIDVTSDEMQIQVPYTQGIFPLRLQLQNGDVLSVNIAVK